MYAMIPIITAIATEDSTIGIGDTIPNFDFETQLMMSSHRIAPTMIPKPTIKYIIYYYFVIISYI